MGQPLDATANFGFISQWGCTARPVKLPVYDTAIYARGTGCRYMLPVTIERDMRPLYATKTRPEFATGPVMLYTVSGVEYKWSRGLWSGADSREQVYRQ